MKKIIAAAATLLILDSCAMLFNDKNVEVKINSNPQGADVIIDGRSYGRTPAVVSIEPKNYVATLTKEGYGSTQIKLETWQAVRAKSGEGGRCIADMLGTILVLPYFSLQSVYCRDFKQPEYFAEIPYSSVVGGGRRENQNGYGENGAPQINSPYGNGGYGSGQQMPQQNNPYRGY